MVGGEAAKFAKVLRSGLYHDDSGGSVLEGLNGGGGPASGTVDHGDTTGA